MSKKCKTRRQEERKKEKQARKESMRQMYQKWAELGQNTKSKRTRLNAGKARQARVNRKAQRNRAHGGSTTMTLSQFTKLLKGIVPE